VASTPGCSARASSGRMAQEGFEPSASLVLSESGLPVAYRAMMQCSSGGWNRTSGLHVQSVASLPAATAPESSIREGGFEPPPPDSKSGSLPVSRFPRAPRGSRTRLSDLGSPCLAARPRTLCSSPNSRFQMPDSRYEKPDSRIRAGSGIRTPVAWLEARSRAAGPIPQHLR
jgi:hypothetical protein